MYVYLNIYMHYIFISFIYNKLKINFIVLVSISDLRKLKATIDNMTIEKMKAEKGDKNKKNKGKGKAKLRLDNCMVSLYHFIFDSILHHDISIFPFVTLDFYPNYF